MQRLVHILVVDDDQGIRTLLSRYLQDHGYVVSEAADAQEARTLMAQFSFDLLIVDVMMPGESGIELTSDLKLRIDVPVMMLTAMGEVEDRIEGLEKGADDYLSKPFEPKELLLRMQNLLKRHPTGTSKSDRMFFGPFCLDRKRRMLLKGSEEVSLSAKEIDMLIYLVDRKDVVISREELAEVSGQMHARSVDVVMTRLRNKIELDPKRPIYLKTIRGEGYVFYL